jgi:solute carrier family 6 GABA transporter-like protein 6/8/11/12/13
MSLTIVTQEYFDNVVLHKTSGIEEFGNIRWALFGLLFFTWVAIYLFVFKGTKSIGKVVYFTAITPYVMLIARDRIILF